MQASDVVNLILEKFGGKVRFDWIGFQNLEVRIHPREYYVSWVNGFQVCEVDEGDNLVQNQFSTWVQGVLNGGVRNDAGELVKQ